MPLEKIDLNCPHSAVVKRKRDELEGLKQKPIIDRFLFEDQKAVMKENLQYSSAAKSVSGFNPRTGTSENGFQSINQTPLRIQRSETPCDETPGLSSSVVTDYKERLRAKLAPRQNL